MIGQTISRYSWSPRLMPADRVMTASSSAMFQAHSPMRATCGRYRGRLEVREMTNSASPINAIEDQPNITILV